MSRTVCKFGGSSVADFNQFRKVKEIVEGDPKRQIIVVSAPGKRQPGETKLTDLLYLCHEIAEMGEDFDHPFQRVRERYLEIQTELNLETAIGSELDQFLQALKDGVSRDYAASRGEFFSGLLMAAHLDAEFVDPAEHIIITHQGTVAPVTYEALGRRMAATGKRYVLPGFFGRNTIGQVKTFSRGGSDITGAIAARACKAELYENWTDVSGLLMADPRIVKNPRHIDEISYKEIRELSYMGASVFHDEAILPVREAGIPIHIRNTDQPEDAGTRIVPILSEGQDDQPQIAGIAGKKDFSMISLEKSLMNKETGFAYRLLGIFEKHGISVEHCPTSIDTMSVIVEDSALADKGDLIRDEILRILQPDRVEWDKPLALVAIVGEGMSHTIGISAKTFTALADANVNVHVINQGASELNILIGVAADELELAVQVLYAAFVE